MAPSHGLHCEVVLSPPPYVSRYRHAILLPSRSFDLGPVKQFNMLSSSRNVMQVYRHIAHIQMYNSCISINNFICSKCTCNKIAKYIVSTVEIHTLCTSFQIRRLQLLQNFSIKSCIYRYCSENGKLALVFQF